MDKIFETCATVLGAIVMVMIVMLLTPFLTFWCGWLSGWLAKLVIGVPLCNAMNTLFNVAYFTPDKLPLIGGALGWIGGFFKSVAKVNK